MRSSFFVLQPLFARKHRVKPGKKPPLCIRVHRKAPSWTGSSCSASLVASHGNISLRCIPEGASDRKKRPLVARYCRHASKISWFGQDMLSMYSKCTAKRHSGIHLAGILPSRRPFPVRIPQIMHSGQILPLFCNSAFCARSGARPALRFVLHCGISVLPA